MKRIARNRFRNSRRRLPLPPPLSPPTTTTITISGAAATAVDIKWSRRGRVSDVGDSSNTVTGTGTVLPTRWRNRRQRRGRLWRGPVCAMTSPARAIYHFTFRCYWPPFQGRLYLFVSLTHPRTLCSPRS